MTFIIKTRGSPGLIASEYLCPIHGRFEVNVENPPDEMECPSVIPARTWSCSWHKGAGYAFDPDCPGCHDSMRDDRCGVLSPWVISCPMTRVNQIYAVTKGKSAIYDRPTFTDTRNLGEGQPLHEWKEDRAKVWEEKRKQDVVAFAREHNERVRGD